MTGWPYKENIKGMRASSTSSLDVHVIESPSNPTFIWKDWGLQGYAVFFLYLKKVYGYSKETPPLQVATISVLLYQFIFTSDSLLRFS